MSNQSNQRRSADPTAVNLGQVEVREWWLWGFAVAVTLLLTLGILSLTFSRIHLASDESSLLSLKEWVRGLAALVLLFDVYTVYQHLQLQRVRRQLAARERLFHLITENAADMIAVVDSQGRRLYNSPAYHRILGYSADELAATSSIEQVHPDDRTRVLRAAERANQTGNGECLEYRIRHKDGSWRVLESTSSSFPGKDGMMAGLVIVNRDITERKQAEALLQRHAFYDDLTNLPNRDLFLDRLQRSIAVSRRHRDFKFAVLFIDIDEFKVFNESLGHAAGDELLIQIARRLSCCLRGADTVSRPALLGSEQLPAIDSTLARPGGDEFVVLLDELRDPSDGVRVSERIRERLDIPFAVNGQEIVVTASIGIVFGSNTASEAPDVLRDAEIAMYRAKRGGKARCEVFDAAMQAEAVKRLQLETDLRKGLELDEFRVHYQALVTLPSPQIVGFEALTRWERPQGLVPPAEFINVADETGIILPLNRKLLREACEQVCRWEVEYPSHRAPLSISVNITAKQFAQPDLPNQIGEILQQTRIDPSRVDLEITENIAMADAGQSGHMLSELKALGVRLSIDDFGTGYSSLCRLKHFPVDALKIDRSFIWDMEGDAETHEIVRTIIMLAHSLGLKVVAEGIETRAQLEMLAELRCDMGQGYLFSKPSDAGTTAKCLKRTHPAAKESRTMEPPGTSRGNH